MINAYIENKLVEALTGKDLRGNKIDKPFEVRWREYLELMRKFETNN